MENLSNQKKKKKLKSQKSKELISLLINYTFSN